MQQSRKKSIIKEKRKFIHVQPVEDLMVVKG
jgi:hypothetical protein